MEIKLRANLPVIILWAWLVSANSMLGGTTQIFSPAGLPRSSSQDYSIPDTTVSTPTFPTPPIPMGESGLQSFSSVPLKEELTTNGSKPSSPIANGQINATLPTANGSVESFFQYAPLPLTKEAPSAKKNLSPASSLGKVIWHTLDNIGIPLPMSKEGDLDPNLSKTYLVEPQQACHETNKKTIHQKIPDSEFGVTDIPEKDDAKLH